MRWGVLLFILCFCYRLQSQSTAGEKAIYESRYIVDMPNAGVLDKGDYVIYSSIFPEGGISMLFEASPFNNFSFGLSYGGVNIVGSGKIELQNIPGIHLKYRVFDETKTLPAFTIGANSQGKGKYSFSDKRFSTLSPGLFIAASKNYSWALGVVSFHGGLNYSLEQAPEDRDPNFYIGMEHSIGKYISANFEYNFQIDEKKAKYYDQAGLFNIAFRWSVAKGVTLELQFRDLLEHSLYYDGFNRAICLEYIKDF